MGCHCTKTEEPPNPQQLQRRLSMTNVDGTGIEDNNQGRGVMVVLDNNALLDMLEITSKTMYEKDSTSPTNLPRKYSIGSVTDRELHRRNSFSSKSLETAGTVVNPQDLGIGFACKKGLKMVSPNQDSFCIVEVEGVSIYGVFDGHGRKGHDISDFVKENLPRLLATHKDFSTKPKDALVEGFLELQKLLVKMTALGRVDASQSGTTASVIVQTHADKTLWIAHVGDSRCVLGTEGGGGKMQASTLSPSQRARKMESKKGAPRIVAEELTIDHKPELPQERERIIARGGQVSKQPYDVNYRVYVKNQPYPGLAMSRAMGDLIGYHEAGISAEPEVSRRPLRIRPNESANGVDKENSKPTENGQGYDQFILLCSDGVWEFISSQEAVDIVSKYPRHRAMDAANDLAKQSWDRWIQEEHGTVVDDITVLIVHL